jgi:hypothetical protein
MKAPADVSPRILIVAGAVLLLGLMLGVTN